MKSGTRWGVQLVAKLWNIIYQLWMHRNNCLRVTEMINTLSSKDILKTAIIHEYALGIKYLPSVYKSYFPSLSKNLKKSTKHQKQWFVAIRSGRESCLIFSHYDTFSTDPALRSWVGLSPLPWKHPPHIFTLPYYTLWFSIQCRLRALCLLTILFDFPFYIFQHYLQANQILLDLH